MMSRCLQDLRDKGVVRRVQGVPLVGPAPGCRASVPRRRGRHGHRPRRRARRGGRHARHLPRHFPRRLPRRGRTPARGSRRRRKRGARAVSSPSRFLRPVALRLRRDVERRAQPEPHLATAGRGRDWRPARIGDPRRRARHRALARGFEAIQRMVPRGGLRAGGPRRARGTRGEGGGGGERNGGEGGERDARANAGTLPGRGNALDRAVFGCEASRGGGRGRRDGALSIRRARLVHSREAADGGAAPRGGDSGGERRRARAVADGGTSREYSQRAVHRRGASAGVARRAENITRGQYPEAARRAASVAAVVAAAAAKTLPDASTDKGTPTDGTPKNDGTLVPGHAAWFRASPKPPRAVERRGVPEFSRGTRARRPRRTSPCATR